MSGVGRLRLARVVGSNGRLRLARVVGSLPIYIGLVLDN